MKKAYICAHVNFPRNDAGANYVYGLAKCLQAIDYKVTVIARGENRREDWDDAEHAYLYGEIDYENIQEKAKNKISPISRVANYFSESGQVIELLERHTVTKDDYIFTYTDNYFYMRAIYRFARQKNVSLCTCVVEHHQAFQYKGKWGNPVFWLERLGFRCGIPISKKVIVISRYLQQYFTRLNCSTFVLPPLVGNCGNIKPESKSESKIYHIIYPGRPLGKDDIDVMVRSIVKVYDKSNGKIRFHITGCNREKIVRMCNLSVAEYKLLEGAVKFYPWMEYDELIKLYQKMDFFLLARKENKVTLANFPSKLPELMSYGIIPVVSKVGDYANLYIRDGESGIVFEKCTVEECTGAIERAISLSEEKKEFLLKNIHALVNDKFDYHIWGTRLREFL